MTNPYNSPSPSFKAQMDNISFEEVEHYINLLNEAVKIRAAFEQAKKRPPIVELLNVRNQLRGSTLMARFFAVLNISPIDYLNKERKAGYRTNLKTVIKVRSVAEYLYGKKDIINPVCKSLFAATIWASINNTYWIDNSDAEQLLLSIPTNNINEELAIAINSLSNLNISHPLEARNQSCQFRTAFNNLDCYYEGRYNDDAISSNGIWANLDSPIMIALRDEWHLRLASMA